MTEAVASCRIVQPQNSSLVTQQCKSNVLASPTRGKTILGMQKIVVLYVKNTTGKNFLGLQGGGAVIP